MGTKPKTEGEKLESRKKRQMFDKGLTPAQKTLLKHDKRRNISWTLRYQTGNDAQRAGHIPVVTENNTAGVDRKPES